MTQLTVRCFNGFYVAVDQRPLTHFYSQKSKALLIYLAVEAERPHERSHLAGLLWPDYPETRARRNLSQTLNALRKDLGGAEIANQFLTSSTHTIGLNHGEALFVDVLEFERGKTAVQKHQHSHLATCDTCTQTLQETVSLYKGQFLDQFGAIDSPLFEAWGLAYREQLSQKAIDLFSQLGTSYEAQNKNEKALSIINQLLELAPWQESGHQQRMRLLAKQGQRIQALNQYDILSQALMRELGVSPSEESDRLYDQILAGEISTTPTIDLMPQPEPETISAPFQAPPFPPHFVKWEKQLSHIREQLSGDSGHTKSIALVGMGGVGKTTIASYLAYDLKNEFPDGVLWANLMVSDPFNILDSWAKAYGFDYSGITDLESKAAAVRNLLTEKRTLIALDNVDDTRLARPLLPNGPQCAVMTTTRNREVAVSLNAVTIQISELDEESSHTLLVKILGEERVNKTAQETAASYKICALLHHLPLAIEIVAQKLKMRPRTKLATIATQLDHVMQRLGLIVSDQAVRGSFEISWNDLSARAKQVFEAMSVFEGRPFTAVALAAITKLNLPILEEELYTLTNLSLVQEVAEIQYKQHPLLADFAFEKLSPTKRVSHKEQLISYYLTFVNTHRDDFEQLNFEYENLNAAIDTAHAFNLWQSVIDFIDSLTPMWRAHGRYTQARRAYKLASDAIEHFGDREKMGDVLSLWGQACIEQNDYDEAQQHLNDSLTLSMQFENEAGVADAHYQLARVAIEKSEYEEAKSLLALSHTIKSGLGDELGIANINYRLARVAFREEDYERARLLAEKALTSQQVFNKHSNSVKTLHLLTNIELKEKNLDKAEQFCKKALELIQTNKLLNELGNNFLLFGLLYLATNELDKARHYFDLSYRQFKKEGERILEATTLYELSIIFKLQGNVEDAINNCKSSLEILKQFNDQFRQPTVLIFLGDLYKFKGAFEQAKTAWEAAEKIADQKYPSITKKLEERQNSII